jgi:hypothetical protein
MASGNEQTHFYITLFSNASQKIYPSNTLSSFTVHLARPVDLGSDIRWDVGVSEMACRPFNLGTYGNMWTNTIEHAFVYCDMISPPFVGSH